MAQDCIRIEDGKHIVSGKARMSILDKIRTAPDNTRVSFLHPDRSAESICDIQELREAVRYTADPCGECYTCEEQRHRNEERDGKPVFRRMILCPECGNKRCPRATFHIYKCTNSNESGQYGSRY